MFLSPTLLAVVLVYLPEVTGRPTDVVADARVTIDWQRRRELPRS